MHIGKRHVIEGKLRMEGTNTRTKTQSAPGLGSQEAVGFPFLVLTPALPPSFFWWGQSGQGGMENYVPKKG